MRVHVGNGFDLISMPPGRGLPSLIASVVAIGGGALFFLVMPIILLIAFLVNKKKGIAIEKTQFRLASNAFLLSGTAIVLNNIAYSVRTTIDLWQAATVAALTPHIWANIIIAILAAVLFVMSLLTLRGANVRTRRKVLFIATACIMVLMLFFMNRWNFFAIL